ncbi:transcriptional regulator [Candidatus Pacearchaeota archaeon]|nr:transcriptional regulator [Candidatus Pacearchaeota archaeon]
MLEEKLCTLKEIANTYGISLKHAQNEIEHIIKSAHDMYLTIDYAECLACDFMFSNRTRLNKPSRCPECKSERITTPSFQLIIL